MWIVVVVEEHYPSVFHCETEEDAKKKYEEYKDSGVMIHLAKVHETNVNTEHFAFKPGAISTFDVRWH